MTNGNDAAYAKSTVFGPDEDHPSLLATYEDGTAGLTKREYFAAMAMEAAISTNHWVMNQQGMQGASAWAVKAADALIAALNEQEAA